MEGVSPLALTLAGGHGEVHFSLIGLFLTGVEAIAQGVAGRKLFPGLRGVVTAMKNWHQSTPSCFATSVYTNCQGRRPQGNEIFSQYRQKCLPSRPFRQTFNTRQEESHPSRREFILSGECFYT